MSQVYSTSGQQQMGLMPLNPNAFSGNAMNLSPIMPGTPSNCTGASFSGVDFEASNNNNNNATAAAMPTSSSAAVDTSMVSTVSTKSTKSTKRKYTHNPYATASNASQASCRSSVASSNASEANNSTPPTPNATSFNPSPSAVAAMAMDNGANAGASSGNYATQIQAMAAAGAYGGAPNAMMMEQFMLPGPQQQSQVAVPHNNNGPYSSAPSHQQHHNNQQNAYHHGAGGHVAAHHPHHNQQRRNNYQHNNQNNMMMMNSTNSSSSLTSTSGSSSSSNHNNNSSNNNNNAGVAGADGGIVMYGGAVHSLKNATEQFDSMRGQLAASSCSQRGRHVVIAMIRLQQPEYTDALFGELVPAWAQLIGDMNGCHVARTFVECLSSARIAELAAALPRDTVLAMCACSQHSRRVLQAMFENHRADLLQPVVDHVVTGCVGLATTQQGCISVMRVLEFSTPTQRTALMAVLSPHLAALAMDPYGNYVVQTIAQSFTREDACATLEKSFEGSWVPLSCNKFASNVVEKLIRIATNQVRKTVVEELCLNQQNLSSIIGDGFGNFVLQAIIDTCANAAEFRKISERVRPLLASSPYGHKIEGKLKAKRFNNSNSNSSKDSSNNSSAQQTPTLTASTPAQQQ